MKELKFGEIVKIDLDPLSHGDDMSILRITAEVVDVQSSLQSYGDIDLDIAVAVFKVKGQEELPYGEVNFVRGSGWDDMEGRVYSIVSLNGGEWLHTAWPAEVDFVQE